MAYVDKINVQGTDYDINDKRLPEVGGVVTLDDDFTANSIVEKMSGYGFTLGTLPTGLTLNVYYAGVVKNGNKVTFAIFAQIGRTGTVSPGYVDGKLRFTIPATLMNKLYPTTIGGVSDCLDDCKVLLVDDASYETTKELITLTLKASGSAIDVNMYNINTVLEDGHTYKFRYEKTFLLSDNLAV